jgi:16S rRNA processing protein RimM
MPSRPAPPQLLRAACVRRPHGVRGELRVEPLGGDAARFVRGLRLTSERDGVTYSVCSARAVSGGDVLLALGEVTTRDAAEALRGDYLCVDATQRRSLGEHEWFVWELVGLEARTVDGDALGRVVDVEEYPEHEVLVVRGSNGEQRRFPMASEFVAGVDVEAGVVTLTPWPEESADGVEEDV